MRIPAPLPSLSFGPGESLAFGYGLYLPFLHFFFFKTINSQTLLERRGTTAIPRQIYLPTRESETDPPKRENARVTSPYHLKAGRKFEFPTALFTKLGTRGAF